MKTKIWLSSPHMGEEEFNFVKDAFDTNWIAPLGPNVNGFEKDLEEFTGAKAAAVLSSGTGAIHLSLVMLGVEAGDEVLCSSMTFSASANPITYVGATPVFIDSESDTWNMSPELMKEAIEAGIAKGKKPKAVILVHLYGMPAKLDEIMAICREHDIPLIEDAAEALGSTYKGKALGTLGEIGILSFNGNKIITTSGGGALISNNEEYVKKARFLSTQARDEAPHYQHSHIGFNYRMSNVCAGIGRGQMIVLPKRVEKKRQIHDFYERILGNVEGISFVPEPEGYFSNRWLSCILIDPKTTGVSREELRLAFEAENIESRPLWKPMHLQPVFADCPAFEDGTSARLFEDGLCLPSGTNMAEEDFERIEACLRKVFKQKSSQVS